MMKIIAIAWLFMSKSLWFLYILKCADKTYYTGITNDLTRRLQQHASGVGAKYTRGRGPFVIAYTETFASRSEASKREYVIKQLSKSEKTELLGVS